MQTNNKKFSFIPLYLFIIICFISLVFSLFTVLSLSSALDENNFDLDGFIVEKYDSTNNSFSVIPFNENSLNNNQKQDFIKKVLKEYIVNRYTVIGSETEANIGYNDVYSFNTGVLLKHPSISGMGKNGNIIWFNAYVDFVNNELPEIKKLISEGTTRSVKILSEPKKVDDWWVVDVEFIYRNPTTYSMSVAKKEKYQLSLNIDFKGIKPTSLTISSVGKSLVDIRKPAGNIFNVFVKDLKKIKL